MTGSRNPGVPRRMKPEADPGPATSLSRHRAPSRQPLAPTMAEQSGAETAPADKSNRPVRVRPEHHLNTGLADYAMWMSIFADAPPRTPKPEPYRRGRIWT